MTASVNDSRDADPRTADPGSGGPGGADSSVTDPRTADSGHVVPVSATLQMSDWSRRVRLVAAAIIFALITLGTVHGADDDFPFGPLRMYASRDNPNGSVVQGVVQAVTRSGRVIDVTNTSGAPRRAELEGRMNEFVSAPERFAPVAAAFVPRSNASAADPYVVIRLIHRSYPLHDGRASAPVDTVVASWSVPR